LQRAISAEFERIAAWLGGTLALPEQCLAVFAVTVSRKLKMELELEKGSMRAGGFAGLGCGFGHATFIPLRGD
jgi:hypothetical protein